jgi:hypothetical protein
VGHDGFNWLVYCFVKVPFVFTLDDLEFVSSTEIVRDVRRGYYAKKTFCASIGYWYATEALLRHDPNGIIDSCGWSHRDDPSFGDIHDISFTLLRRMLFERRRSLFFYGTTKRFTPFRISSQE